MQRINGWMVLQRRCRLKVSGDEADGRSRLAVVSVAASSCLLGPSPSQRAGAGDIATGRKKAACKAREHLCSRGNGTGNNWNRCSKKDHGVS